MHTKLVVCVTTALIGLGALFFLVVEFNNPGTLGNYSWKGKFLGALFQSVTTRTAGFNTIDQAALTDASKFMSTILMLIGASPASTGGGIKTTTVTVLLLTVFSIIRGKQDTEIFSRRIPGTVVRKALAIVTINLTIFIMVSMILSLIESYPLIDLLYETASALGTVGLATFIIMH